MEFILGILQRTPSPRPMQSSQCAQRGLPLLARHGLCSGHCLLALNCLSSPSAVRVVHATSSHGTASLPGMVLTTRAASPRPVRSMLRTLRLLGQHGPCGARCISSPCGAWHLSSPGVVIPTRATSLRPSHSLSCALFPCPAWFLRRAPMVPTARGASCPDVLLVAHTASLPLVWFQRGQRSVDMAAGILHDGPLTWKRQFRLEATIWSSSLLVSTEVVTTSYAGTTPRAGYKAEPHGNNKP